MIARMEAAAVPVATALADPTREAKAKAASLPISFAARADGGTDVSVHHSGWEARGEEAAAKRNQHDSGWPATLAAFGATVDNPRSAA